MSKSYSELSTIDGFDKRLEYLSLSGVVGEETLGSRRWLCQDFYSSKEWRDIRKLVILRDDGCDLGLSDFPIFGRVYVHHINPITAEDLISNCDKVFSLDNLICVSERTHQKIHYGDLRAFESVEWKPRSRNDTAPWKEVVNGQHT